MSKQSKYSLNDTVIFRYMDRQRWGNIESIHLDYDLKRNIRFKYSIRDMSQNIQIDEKNVFGKVENLRMLKSE